ncbi:fatty alcohol oxidase [Nannizzia gypsea CBS 118893]|uniref:Fatty alcohol oxidase n=1 Tax=Arthroderma gypseum (strain ATCC MYA-4604 / CBS 118893) TaxID=535722 RepID=E4V2J0_ARTGP|nr:fatty alcohol oxidase [Nannizzia gypsea CBS 118893]EFR04255.1 fatty alcohol oxidase [Nannizzia gypsea CBS 118893]
MASTVQATPLPPAPRPEDLLSPAQWETLLAVADTVIPSVKCADSANSTSSSPSYASSSSHLVSRSRFDDLVSSLRPESVEDEPAAARAAAQYLDESASSIPGFKESLCRTLALHVHQEGLRGIKTILAGLNNFAVSLALTGSRTPFQNQPYSVRRQILSSWRTSYLPPLRAAHRALVALTKKSWVGSSPSLPLVLGFPSVPVHGAAASENFPYSFLQFPAAGDGAGTEIIETDVVIVGSGCGAGVAAKNLAEAGHRVIVVEKSYFFPNDRYPMAGSEGAFHLFSNGGAELSDDGSIGVVSGSTWGGGGTINWSASLQTQSMVREEWANGGLPVFTSSAYQASLDRVCDYMGVSTDFIKQNHGNSVLMEGARKLGYTAKAVPQNTGHQQHDCGYCTLGCAAGAEKVLFARKHVRGKKVAVGVRGTWTSRDASGATHGKPAVTRKVVIKAKKVIVSCGTLESPLLLLRSGLNNPQIGRNLHLHPVLIMSALFDHETRPWEGSILTSLVSDFENLDGRGHGTKIEAVVMLPNFFLPLMTWDDGLDYKVFAANARRMAGFISLTRDRDSGRVYPDPNDGRCRIDYTPSAFDRKHLLEGIIGAAKIAYVSGAKEIRSSSRAIPTFTRPDPSSDAADEGVNNAAFQEWIRKLRTGVPLPTEQSMFASAHQMGTCRMGTSPKTSVVDPTGMVWGTSGLYVADASVFPSASGVNPMVTNMAITDITSRKLADTMKQEDTAALKSRL